MNELIARDIVLMRAIESTDSQHEILSDDDRLYASRSAKELAQWQAADTKSATTVEVFLQHRAAQLLKKITERYPAFAALTRQHRGILLLSLALPLLAFLSGILIDRVANPHRVDLLSWPLLVIVLWNALVYGWMLLAAFMPSWHLHRIDADWFQGLRRQARPRRLPAGLVTALLHFAADWARLSQRLTGARLRRTMHLCAALLAAGVIASLYAHGLLSQYAVGWESTFLSGAQVERILAFVFAPAVYVFQLPPFTLADIEALRFTQGPSAADGARWVHLYAGTLFLLVVLPRAILAAWAHWQARRLAKNFPLDLQQPYFQKFNAAIGARPMTLRVLPYSYSLDEARHKGLAAMAEQLFGTQVQVMLRPSLPYGEEPAEVLKDTPVGDENTLTAVLFSMAATPEKEAHGALLTYLAHPSRRGIAVLIDESGFLKGAGNDPESQERLAQRILLWEQFCRAHQAHATIVNLLNTASRPLEAGSGLKLSGTT